VTVNPGFLDYISFSKPLKVSLIILAKSLSFVLTGYTTVRMANRYGHIGQTSLKKAMESISGAGFEEGSFAFTFDVGKVSKVDSVN
jgi:hypothetical protein